MFGIAGGAPGVNGVVEADPDGYRLIVLANLDPPAAEQIARKFRELLGEGEEQGPRIRRYRPR